MILYEVDNISRRARGQLGYQKLALLVINWELSDFIVRGYSIDKQSSEVGTKR